MRVLVTGGAGFIGSNFVRRLLETSDDQVTVYDCLTYAGDRENLADLESDPGSRGRFRFVLGNVTDRRATSAAMAGHDAVVHMAAESHVDRSIASPDEFVHTNCDGTNVVMDVARRAGVDRVVHVSTDEVYGSIADGSFHETDTLGPRSPYAAAKAGSDLIALSYVTTYGLPVLVTRSCNNFGPYQHPEKVIPLFVTNLLDGLRVPLYGDGLNVRDWLFVEDNCAAIDVVLRHGQVGEIYNVGAGNELTNLDLTAMLVALVGATSATASAAVDAAIEWVPDRLGHDRRYSVDTAKIRGLGWRPAAPFEEALAATVRWYRDHREWWERRRATAPAIAGPAGTCAS